MRIYSPAVNTKPCATGVGCEVPTVNYTYNGSILKNSRIPYNHTVTVHCGEDFSFDIFCDLGNNTEVPEDGVWSPAPSCGE